MKAAAIAVCLVCISAIEVSWVAHAQPFAVEPEDFEPSLTEPMKRLENNYIGFVFDFNTATESDTTPNGNLKQNQASTNGFLSTLPGDGNGQTLVTLGPCAGNNPHVHPRGSEISFLLYGAIEFGMVEENSAMNNLVLRNLKQNETISVPQGVLHFSFNPNCQPAAFLANFATKDPGTQTMWSSMMHIPNRILNSATGIPEATFAQLKSQYRLVTAPGTGGEACMRKCGLTFNSSNHLVPLSVAASA